MTSHNARLNQTNQINDQLRTLCLKFALESRMPDEAHDRTMQRARDFYDFLRAAPPSQLELVSGNDMPRLIPDEKQ